MTTSTLDIDRPAWDWPPCSLLHPMLRPGFADDALARFADYLAPLRTPWGFRREEPLHREPLITAYDNAELMAVLHLCSDTPIRAALFRPHIDLIFGALERQFDVSNGMIPGWWRDDGTPTPYRVANGEVVEDADGNPVTLVYPLYRIAECCLTVRPDADLTRGLVTILSDAAIHRSAALAMQPPGADPLPLDRDFLWPHALRRRKDVIEPCWVHQGGVVKAEPFLARYKNRVPWSRYIAPRTMTPRHDLALAERALTTQNPDGGWPKTWKLTEQPAPEEEAFTTEATETTEVDAP